MSKHKFSLVACARWEEKHIQEWVEYHKSIGFDHIYLYSNDEDPAELFRAVAPYVHGFDPFVTFRHWPHIGEQPQIYLHFLKTFKHETEWFSFLDIDEFFVLKGLDDIFAFMLDHEARVDCLYFNWVIYGNSNKVRREDGPTLTSYLRRAGVVDTHTKMLCRAAAVDAALVQQGLEAGRGAFWHFLDNYKLPGVRCRDVLNAPTDGYAEDFPLNAIPLVAREGFSETVLDCGYIAHFQFRSEEDFLRRWRRGGFPNGEQWKAAHDTGVHRAMLAQNNAVYDTYLAEYWYNYTAPALRFGLRPHDAAQPGENVALNKPSFQSSVFEPDGAEAPFSRLAGGGNNGMRTGTYGFHTSYEIRPWWIVDLLMPHYIEDVHIYNRGGDRMIAARANDMDVLASDDGSTWTMLLSYTKAEPFGGDGAPLVVPGRSECRYRFVMLRLRGTGCLHMDEVEVYGHPAGTEALAGKACRGPIVTDA
ncbi:glycosyltransferase family 2 protein [Rhodopila sp.]|uniref:glycosyltransferase family 2 protein n=1 Tax=Rhodopila sp. TaxID=2480087 RepID=UPI003D15239A